MLRSLVGSEMCIRDSAISFACCIWQLFSVVCNAVFIIVSSSVSDANFTAFSAACLGPYQLVELFTLIGSYTFVLQISMLGYLQLDLASDSHILPVAVLLALLVPAIGIFLLVVNSASVIAQHGGLHAKRSVTAFEPGDEISAIQCVLQNVLKLKTDAETEQFYASQSLPSLALASRSNHANPNVVDQRLSALKSG
eukprot:TRINITY_DN24428_c0_g1_i3.p1 TRINITY_DN24428_c0_g1~~TRINITY_DN24428_c0_g1_i3.p1  ORF type:complete len:230 (+),score=52.15 TRINITY_DN24428_c0_g1_i3:104-691(+)